MKPYLLDSELSVYSARPGRTPSPAADVLTPLLQALISGVLAGLIASGGVALFGWDWRVVPGVAALVLTGMWVLLLIDHRRLLWAIETRQDFEIQPEPEPERPERPTAPRLILEVKHDGARRGFDFLQLPVTPETFQLWARAVLNGESLAINQWVGRGKQFSRGEYETLLAELERAGIVRLIDVNNPQAGRELTRPGKAALRAAVHVHGHGGATSIHAPQAQE